MRTLVKRFKAAGHEETNVIINWGATSQEDIKLLATYYIQHRVERQLQENETKIPEQVTVFAGDFLHREVREVKPLNIPKAWKEAPKSKARKELEALYAQLSPEDRAVLLGS